MTRNTLVIAATIASLSLATGCDQRLTPERVRELLDNPTGDVTPDGMSRATRDLFQADRATGIETFANLLKLDQAGSNAIPRNPAGAQFGVLEDTGDVFCVGGLVASIATFDACERGDDCKAEFTLDSCVLRLGDEGDEDARGKIKFKLENTVEDSFARSAMELNFEGWESSRDDALLDTFAGLIALDVTDANDGSNTELVFASDLDVNVKRKQRGLFDDGIEEHTNVSAGVRFKQQNDDDSFEGSLEVLAFVDEDGNREESVAISFAAEGHEVDADTAVASASLSVVGSNGTFSCTWSGAEEQLDRDGARVTSNGECIDEDGETFSFSGEAVSD